MSDETIHLELQARTVTGKAVKQLREQGIVPAVIHNHGKDSVVVQGPYMELRHVYQKAGKHHPVNITAGSRNYLALIKTATFEPKKNQLTHLVFNAVKKNQKVEAEVPVRPRYAEGNEATPAERASLIVLEQLDAVTVRAVPDKIPSFLEYDAEKLVAVGDQVTVAHLIVPDGVEIEDEPEHPVATVFEPAALEAANNNAGNSEAEEASGEPATTEESGKAEAPAAEQEA